MKNRASVLTSLLLIAGAVVATPAAWAQTRDADLPEAIQSHLRIIDNPEDSDSTRTAQARELIESGTPTAIEQIRARLSGASPSSTKIIICKAITLIAQENPGAIPSGLRDDLLPLLADSNGQIVAAAAEALSPLVDARMLSELFRIARDDSGNEDHRLAVLTVLEANTDRRDVVGELVQLADADNDAVRQRARDILAWITGLPQPLDMTALDRWWDERAQMDDAQWLRGQVRRFARQLRSVIEASKRERNEQIRQFQQVADRLADALSAVYRLTPQPDREALLLDWLHEDRVQYRKVAARLVAEQISEGSLPSASVRAALRDRFDDPSPEVRKSAIEVIAALNDPSDANAMLDRLSVEENVNVRETILRVIGRLNNPRAVDHLMAELTRPDAPDRCAAAAADSLRTLADRGELPKETLASLVQPLKTIMNNSGAWSNELRAAVLGAMAAIGSPEFRPEFVSYLESDDTELLLRAIRGVAAIEDTEQIDKLAALLTHHDARVRQRAADALGAMGGAAQLDVLAARLDPAVETAAGPRESARKAYFDICKRLSPVDQLAAADKLQPYPEQRLALLEGLHKQLVTLRVDTPVLTRVREELARLNDTLVRPTKAAQYWGMLVEHASAQNDPARFTYAAAWLKSSIKADGGESISQILSVLATADEGTRRDAEKQVIDYLTGVAGQSRERHDALAAGLRETLSPQVYPALHTYLARYGNQNGESGQPASQPRGANTNGS